MKRLAAIFEAYDYSNRTAVRKVLRSTSRKIGTPGWYKEMYKHVEMTWLKDIMALPEMKEFMTNGNYSLCSSIIQVAGGTLEFTKDTKLRGDYNIAIFLKSNYLRLIGMGEPRMILRGDQSKSDIEFTKEALQTIKDKYHIHGPKLVSKSKASDEMITPFIEAAKSAADENGISGINWDNLEKFIPLHYSQKGEFARAIKLMQKFNKASSDKLIIPITTGTQKPNVPYTQYGKEFMLNDFAINPKIRYHIIIGELADRMLIKTRTPNIKDGDFEITANVKEKITLDIKDLDQIHGNIDYNYCNGISLMDDEEVIEYIVAFSDSFERGHGATYRVLLDPDKANKHPRIIKTLFRTMRANL